MTHSSLTAAVETLNRLQQLVKEQQTGVDNDIRVQTELVAGHLSALMDDLREGKIKLSTNEILQISVSMNEALSLLGAEVEQSKAKLRQQMKASQMHKSYSGS